MKINGNTRLQKETNGVVGFWKRWWNVKKQQNLDSNHTSCWNPGCKEKLKCGSGVAIGAQRRNLGTIYHKRSHLPTTQLEHKMPTHVGQQQLTKCPHDISYHSFFFLTLHNLHIYKWYTDNFLKRRLHPSSSFIYYHILQSKTIFHFFFFLFPSFQRPCHQMWLGNVKTKRG